MILNNPKIFATSPIAIRLCKWLCNEGNSQRIINVFLTHFLIFSLSLSYLLLWLGLATSPSYNLPFSHKNSTISLVPNAAAQFSNVCPTSSVKLMSTCPLVTAASSASVSLPRMQSMSCLWDLSPRAPAGAPEAVAEPSPLAPLEVEPVVDPHLRVVLLRFGLNSFG